MCEIADAIHISTERAFTFLYEHLSSKKLFAMWMLYLLFTILEEFDQWTFSFVWNMNSSLHSFNERAVKKRMFSREGKNCFRGYGNDFVGVTKVTKVIQVCNKERQHSTTWCQLTDFDVQLKKKRLLAKEKVLFHDDNALSHSCVIAITNLIELPTNWWLTLDNFPVRFLFTPKLELIVWWKKSNRNTIFLKSDLQVAPRWLQVAQIWFFSRNYIWFDITNLFLRYLNFIDK